MAQLGTLQDNERNSFKIVSDSGNPEVAQRVAIIGSITAGSGGLLDGVSFDTIVASYPNSTTEVYDYKIGGVSGTLSATVTVIYTNSTKEFVSSVVRT